MADPSPATPAAAPPAPGSVALRGVAKRFGEHLAVAGVDLEVHPGEFLALLGPSGCGKTTILRMIAGLETPDTGRIEVSGQDVTGLPPGRRGVHTVFQSYALFGHLDVRRNVEFGLRQQRVPMALRRQRAMEALEVVRLAHLADRRPAQLSGGQQQRVALARAIVLQPPVLLLDEPLAALDLQLRKEMQLELKRLHRELGCTFVFVTHDQGEAMSMADRVGVMSDGRVEQLDRPDVVYDRPATPFVAGFIGDMNLFEGVCRDGRVAAPEGLITLPGAPEGPVLVCLRPELLHIGDAPNAGVVRLSARLHDVNVLGDSVRVVLERTGPGLPILARRPRGEQAALCAFGPGEHVSAWFRPEDALVYPGAAR